MTMPRGILYDIANKKLAKRQSLANCHVVKNCYLRNVSAESLDKLCVGETGIHSSMKVFLATDKSRLRVIGSGFMLWSLNLCRHRAFAARGRELDLSFQFDEWLAANPLPGASSPSDNGRLRTSSGTNEWVADQFRHGNVLKQLPEISSRVRNDGLREVEELGLHGRPNLESELWMSDQGNRPMVRRLPVLKHDGIWWEDRQGHDSNGVVVHGKFSWRDTADIFYECLRECGQMVWNNKHKCFMQVNRNASTEPLVFVPPAIQLPMHASDCTASEYLKLLRDSNDGFDKRRFLLALVSSSAAALGVFEDDDLLVHKVITAYTVRAKQGKAQLHHLRQGGPGRMSAGGGIRARETERLFSRICEKLGEWQKEIEGCKFLYFSGNMRVWNEVYACNDPKLLVARDDIRWHKVPYSVRQPRLRELQRVYYGLSHGAVSYGVP